jgi:hypothetical protein
VTVEFVLLLSGDGGASASAAELGARTARMAGWVTHQRAAGVIRLGGHVDGPAVRVRRNDGRHAVVDVPADAAGNVQSWLLIDAADLDAAVSLARGCPEAAHGEVRVLAVDADGAVP